MFVLFVCIVVVVVVVAAVVVVAVEATPNIKACFAATACVPGLKKSGGSRGAQPLLPRPSEPSKLRRCPSQPSKPKPCICYDCVRAGLKKKKPGGAAPRRGGGVGGGGALPPPILLRLQVAVFHFLPQTISCGFFFCVLFADEIESCLILFVPLFSVQSAYVCLLSFLSVGMKFHL